MAKRKEGRGGTQGDAGARPVSESAARPASEAAAPPGPEPVAQAGPSTFAGVFGEVVSLLIMPASHKHLFLTDLEWLVMPPLMLRQFRLWRQEDRPVAFASWAFLSEEVEARVLSGARKLKPTEWKSGDRAWLMDVVAPSSETANQMIGELKRTAFPDRPLKGMQQQANGGSALIEF